MDDNDDMSEWLTVQRAASTFVAECKSSGMSRLEAEAAVRSYFLATFGSERIWEGTVRYVGGTQASKDKGYRDWIHLETSLIGEWAGAIRRHYPADDASEAADLVRYMSSHDVHKKSKISGPMVWIDLVREMPIADLSIGDVGGQVSDGWVTRWFSPWDIDYLTVSKVTRIPPRLARSAFASPEWPFTVRVDSGDWSRNRAPRYSSWCVGSMSGGPGTWRLSGKPRAAGDDPHIQRALGLRLSTRYSWTADLSVDDGPQVRLLIGPHEAKEIFRLREIEDGEQRRKALLHLVKRHHRRQRFTARDSTEVREHLRGRESFDWFGVKGVLTPSRLEMEKAQ